MSLRVTILDILFPLGGWGMLQSVWAADIVGLDALLNSAQQAVAERDYARALGALATALEQVRLAAPLAIEPVLLVTEPAKFYGDYTPRVGTTFQRGEILHFYLEPNNLVYPRTAQGTYEPSFQIDLQMLSPDETVLATKSILDWGLERSRPLGARYKDMRRCICCGEAKGIRRGDVLMQNRTIVQMFGVAA